jgi:hypothetical protein
MKIRFIFDTNVNSEMIYLFTINKSKYLKFMENKKI